MKKTMALTLSVFLLAPLIRSQGLDELNVVAMSWLIKCYQGIRPGAAKPAEVPSTYSRPAFFDRLGQDQDSAKERNLIKTTFNLSDVVPVSQEELWLKDKEPMGLVALARDEGGSLTIELERLDASWLHYRISAYETDNGREAVMRSAFSIPRSMTLREAVVFGFEDSRDNPLFVSLRINSLNAEGAASGKAANASPEKEPNIADRSQIQPEKLQWTHLGIAAEISNDFFSHVFRIRKNAGAFSKLELRVNGSFWLDWVIVVFEDGGVWSPSESWARSFSVRRSHVFSLPDNGKNVKSVEIRYHDVGDPDDSTARVDLWGGRPMKPKGSTSRVPPPLRPSGTGSPSR
jgi:hypothetical protein